jgi:hypothetical protein
LAITKQYPQLIKSLVWAQDKYRPLTLSGVVSSDDPNSESKKYQTVLPAIIEYHWPYLITQGSPTSFKVAINIAINTISGMSMIRAGKFSLDIEDDLIDSGLLDTTPFLVTYKPTNRSMPNTHRHANNNKQSFGTLNTNLHISYKTITACMTEEFKNTAAASAESPPPRE